MFCGNCGAQLANDAIFCSECGTDCLDGSPNQANPLSNFTPEISGAYSKPSPGNETFGCSLIGLPKKQSIIIVAVCAATIIAAFFMPWFTAFGIGMSGYDLAILGSYAGLLWIIPGLALIPVAITIVGSDNRIMGIICGAVPLVVLVALTSFMQGQEGSFAERAFLEGAKNTTTIGIYLTVIAAVLIVVFGARGKWDLIVVVGVLITSSILTTVALSSSHSYNVRAKVSDGVLAASSCKIIISEMYQFGDQNRMRPNGWGCESFSPLSRYVASITTDANGRITVTAQNVDQSVDGKVLTMTPSNVSGAPLTYRPGVMIERWVCGGPSTTIPEKYLPESCRGR